MVVWLKIFLLDVLQHVEESSSAAESFLEELPENNCNNPFMEVAAPLIFSAKNYDHRTPLLRGLCWLCAPQ